MQAFFSQKTYSFTRNIQIYLRRKIVYHVVNKHLGKTERIREVEGKKTHIFQSLKKWPSQARCFVNCIYRCKHTVINALIHTHIRSVISVYDECIHMGFHRVKPEQEVFPVGSGMGNVYSFIKYIHCTDIYVYVYSMTSMRQV